MKPSACHESQKASADFDVSFDSGNLSDYKSVCSSNATVGDLRRHFDNHPVAMVVYDWATLTIVIANRATARQYAYEVGELAGKSVLCLRRAVDIDAFHASRAAILPVPGTTGTVGEWTHVRKDGSELNVKIHYQVIGDTARPLCLVSYLDVTELTTARQEAVRSKRMLEAILNSVPLPVYWKDTESRYLGCNAAFAREVGLTDAGQVCGMTDGLFPWGQHADEIRRSDIRALLLPERQFSYHRRVVSQPSEEERWYALSKVAFRNDCGRVVGVLSVHEDITKQKVAEANLRIQSRALDACLNAVLVTRPGVHGNVIEYANPAFERITGYARIDWCGRDCAFLQREDRDQPGLEKIRAALTAQQEIETVVRNYRADGQMFLNHLVISPVRNDLGVVTHHIAVLNDVTEVTATRRELEFQANFDTLTRLPNRSYFVSQLNHVLQECAAVGVPVAVGFLDLDDFKVTNDSLGHNVGDALLKEVARRLSVVIKPGGMVSRYGGDEFALFVQNVGTDPELRALADTISNCLSGSAILEGHQVELSSSLGICASPKDGSDADILLKRADAAMYQAKSVSRGAAACIYTAVIGANIERRHKMLKSLRRAVRQKEFSLVFQPQVNYASRRIIAVEALIRWTDIDTGQVVAPAEFIPLAEETSLIVSIGNWVLAEACRHAKMLSDDGFDIKVAVNVSPRQFADGSITSRVAATLAELGLGTDALELEITEGTLTTHGFVPLIRDLAKAGISIAVDDFGTGYSNLSVLRTVRPGRIKLDMSLVRGIGVGPEEEALIHAALSLGRAFGATVLAEGVETAEQRDFLSSNGCHDMQGYFFAKPMSFGALVEVLRNPNSVFLH